MRVILNSNYLSEIVYNFIDNFNYPDVMFYSASISSTIGNSFCWILNVYLIQLPHIDLSDWSVPLISKFFYKLFVFNAA